MGAGGESEDSIIKVNILSYFQLHWEIYFSSPSSESYKCLLKFSVHKLLKSLS